MFVPFIEGVKNAKIQLRKPLRMKAIFLLETTQKYHEFIQGNKKNTSFKIQL